MQRQEPALFHLQRWNFSQAQVKIHQRLDSSTLKREKKVANLWQPEEVTSMAWNTWFSEITQLFEKFATHVSMSVFQTRNAQVFLSHCVYGHEAIS